MAKTSTRGFEAGREHLATVYAQALLGASEKSGNTEQVMLELDSLVDDVLNRLPQLSALLSSPRVSVEDKDSVLDRAIGGQASRVLVHGLKVMARHGRLDVLRDMRDAFRKLYNQLRGKVEVQVRSPAPLDAGMQTQIADRLRAMLKRDVELKTQVDPDLLGGLVVRVGDMLYDGSLKTRLNLMRERTLRSAEQALRARLDRFVST